MSITIVAGSLIPTLLASGYWRHIVHRTPLHYKAALWSIVFPLGMYAVAGIQLGRTDELPLLAWIGEAWVGVGTWLLTFAAMVVALTSCRQSQPPALLVPNTATVTDAGPVTTANWRSGK